MGSVVAPEHRLSGASQVALVVKNLPANAGDIRDAGLIPGLSRSSGGGHGNPLQYSCLENPKDRGAWQATIHGVAKSWTRLKQLTTRKHRLNSVAHGPSSFVACGIFADQGSNPSLLHWQVDSLALSHQGRDG